MSRFPKRPTQTGEFFDWLRTFYDAVIQGQILHGTNTRRIVTPRGTFLEAGPAAPATGGGKVDPFLVEMVYRDYLVCQPVTLDEAGRRVATITTRPISPLEPGLVRIAKPDELRYTGWDSTQRSIAGLTPEIDGYNYAVFPHGLALDDIKNPYDQRTRTLVDGEEYLAESVTYTDEDIWPKYVPGHSIIYAARVTGTPIMTVTETEIEPVATLEQTEYAVEWVDLNVAGRTFQPAERKVKVCVNGQTGNHYVLIRASDAFQEEA